ncbi:hypothetical protein ABZW18_26180 [Streptomyces sp. NPDC004647]|uniref:hypothetical protein n=1 Tax=Streptomyces sp. NPDC004647 TaxID=3154671 RepID=UPI0033BBD6F4
MSTTPKDRLDGLRAVYAVSFYEAAEDGNGPKPGGRSWSKTVDAHPAMSPDVIAHQVWLHLNREHPDIPDLDMTSPTVQRLGYCDAETSQPVHGVRCTHCGSEQVSFTVRQWANCHACRKGQTQDDATLCQEACEDCQAKAL